MEAAPGIEPGITDLQSVALPLGYAAAFFRAWTRRARNVNEPGTLRNGTRAQCPAPFASSQRSASMAAMQPVPAAVTAWR